MIKSRGCFTGSLASVISQHYGYDDLTDNASFDVNSVDQFVRQYIRSYE